MTTEPNVTYTILGAYVEQLELKKREVAVLEQRVRQLEKAVAMHNKEDQSDTLPSDINEV